MTHIYGRRDKLPRMRKATVDLPDALLRDVKKLALKERTTVKALIEQRLRTVVKEWLRRGGFTLRKASFEGDGLVAGPIAAGLSRHSRSDLRRARGVIALDTNILVYAHRVDAEGRQAAARAVARLAEGSSSCCGNPVAG